MPGLILPNRFYIQPQGAVEVDPQYYQYGLTAAITFDGVQPYDAVTGTALVTSGTPIQDVGPSGTALRANAITDYWVVAADSQKVLSTSGNTIILSHEKTDATNRQSASFSQNDAADNTRFSCNMPWSDGTLYFDHGGTGIPPSRLAITGLSFVGPQTYAFSGGAAGLTAYRNGVLLSSSSNGSTRVATAGAFWLNKSAGTNGDLARFYCALVFNQQIPNELQRELSLNPWQVFRTRPRKIYADIASGGAPTAIVASDTLTASVTDVATLLSASSLTDTFSISVTEAISLLATSIITDTLTPGVSDIAAVQAQNVASDSLTPSVTDAASVTASLVSVDGLTPSVTEATAVTAGVAITDLLTPSLTEAQQSTIYAAVLDALTATLGEQQGSLLYSTITDVIPLSVSEAVSVLVAHTATDTLTISITDVAGIVTGDVIAKTVSDALAPYFTLLGSVEARGIWTEKTAIVSVWSTSSAASSTWTPVTPATGTWTENE